MALTISLEGKGIIAYCNALSDTAGGTWTEVGGGAIEAATDAYLCGSSCIAGAYSNKSGAQRYQLPSTLDFDTAGTEENQFIYIWMQTSTIYLHESIANGGLRVNVMTDTSNYRTFMIAAGDDTNGWTGDWKCFVIDPTKPGSVTDTGTYDAGSITYIEVYLDITALAKGNNFLIDMITVASGLRVTGTSTTPWQDIVDYCNDFTTRAWGVVQQREGVIYVYGKIYFGDSTQGAASSFTETSAPIVRFGTSEYYYSSAWALSVPTDYAGIVIEDNTSYTTTFDDGVIVGTDNGRSGTTFLGHTDINVTADLYGGNSTSSLTRLYGTQFRNMKGGVNMGNDAQHLAYGVSFAGCGQFDPIGAPILRNLILAETADVDAALLWNENINIADCKFIANTVGAAIEHPSAVGTPYSHSDLIMSGNTYDILNSSGSAITITLGGDSNSNNYEGSTVNFESSIQLTLTVKDEVGDPVVGASAYIDNDDQSPYILNTTTNESGIATTPYSGSPMTNSRWRVRKYGYKPFSQNINTGSVDIDLPVTLVADSLQT